MKGNAPMLATLRIRELDKLVARLKQNSAKCMKTIERDEQDLEHIENEILKIKARYDPLCARLTGRKQDRDDFVKQHDELAAQFGQFLSDTKQRLRQSNNQQIHQLRRFAKQDLEATRGYQLGKGSTFAQSSSKRK